MQEHTPNRRTLSILLATLTALSGAATAAPLPDFAPTDASRYLSTPVVGNSYIIQTNLWNPAVVGGYTMSGLDSAATSFNVSNYTAHGYFFPAGPATEPGCTLNTDADDLGCNWAGTGPSSNGIQIHAPAAYPSIFRGCHWGNCTIAGDIADVPGVDATQGAPFPMKLHSVTSLNSDWRISVPASGGVFNVSYDIWLDTNSDGYLPNNPQLLSNPGQNDGAEIMVWMHHRGYAPTPEGNPVRPAGELLPQNTGITVPGFTGTWDAWTARVQSWDNPKRWNVISFVRPNGQQQTELIGDTSAFLDVARTLSCRADPSDARFVGADKDYVPCLRPEWWVTSVQAGFEIWNGEFNGGTIATTSFSVTPVLVRGGPNTGGRSLDDGTPLVHWEDTFQVEATACPNATVTYNFWGHAAGETDASDRWVHAAHQPMTESPAGTGNYVATQGPLTPFHDFARLVTFVQCPGSAEVNRSDSLVFIDPSGKVRTPNGAAIEGATVTLLRSNSAAGPFVAVVNGDEAIMDPAINVANPDLTNIYGYYRWDVVPGFYRVRAQKAGCGPAVQSAVLQVVDIAITDVDLTLGCPEPTTPPPVQPGPPAPPGAHFPSEAPSTGNSSGVTVQITPMSDWNTGFCRNVFVTNNTDQPVNWQATLVTTGRIYDMWNVKWKQNGTQVSFEGVSWNDILQPRQTSHSIGFCAHR